MQTQKEYLQIIKIPPLQSYFLNQPQHSSDQLQLKLLAGEAEIFGFQVKKNYPIKFHLPLWVIIWSWEGCQIEFTWPDAKDPHEDELGQIVSGDISEFMTRVLSVHYDLTMQRKLAQENIKKGPFLAIFSHDNSLSHLTSKLLLNYTAKINMPPIFVDLDVENSQIFMDGTIGATVYEYRINFENMFEKCEKISFLYGNRKIYHQTFIELANLLSTNTTKKIKNELDNYKWKGTKQEVPTFAAGGIIQLPKVVNEEKSIQFLSKIMGLFPVTHALVLDTPWFTTKLSEKHPNLSIYEIQRPTQLENINFVKQNKLVRYFGSQQNCTQQITISINEIHLYKIQGEDYRCRLIDLKTEFINKTSISIVDCQRDENTNNFLQIGKMIKQSPVLFACKIYNIKQDDIILEVPILEGFWDSCKSKVWVSMVASTE